MRIGARELSADRPYVIAEAGVNHNGDVAFARKLIDAVKVAGADAVKFQTFTVEEIVTENAGQAEYQAENTGINESQASMLAKLALSHEQFRGLKNYADGVGIEFLSTPFSISDADFLHSLDIAAYKVSSGDLTNIPFLEHIAQFGKPVLLSTGMATLEEVRESFETLKGADVILMQCTSEYPTPPAHANLRVIETLRKKFGVPVGFSDHTEGIETSVYAASLGAVVIEKHFTLDRSLPGPDHRASLEPDELKEMITKIRGTAAGSLDVPEGFLGSSDKQPTESELKTKQLVRKGIAARTDITKGTTLSDTNIFIARPEGFIAPRDLSKVLGKSASRDIPRGTSLSWDMMK